ncbi:hypothetical protein EGW08_011332 [Elysia chlorotica]|uniref:Attacin C-terminal domain-containing protein n=1 Tax=Elysia chlorotica TaxID=188477 RepID=A0A3S0ZR88_ELYCH|nr:hypothetical protein EGW08_011332 [Elysia chlorotica]
MGTLTIACIAVLVAVTSAQVALEDGDMRRGLGEPSQALRKRQSKFDLGINKSPYGVSGTAGVSHTTTGGHKFGGSVTHNVGGSTSGRLDYSKSFANGRGSIGAHVNQDFNTGHRSYGVGVGWNFKRGIRGEQN